MMTCPKIFLSSSPPPPAANICGNIFLGALFRLAQFCFDFLFIFHYFESNSLLFAKCESAIMLKCLSADVNHILLHIILCLNTTRKTHAQLTMWLLTTPVFIQTAKEYQFSFYYSYWWRIIS
jgi:hypothetical protein